MRQRFVEGVPYRDEDTNTWRRKYPSVRDLAREFNVSPSMPATWSKRDKWLDERKKSEKKWAERIFSKVAEEQGEAPPVGAGDALTIVDQMLEQVGFVNGKPTIRVETIQDFERLAKFQVWLKHEKARAADPGSGVITLDMLRARHMHRRRAELEKVLTGEIDPDEATETAEGDQVAAANQAES
jgi:hypothetical protein